MALQVPQPCTAVCPGTEEAIRDFNRFYTHQVGLLNRRFLDSPYSLTEVRVLYELAQRASQIPTATQVASGLSLDPGYLSRLLKKLERRGHLKRGQAEHDARQRPLSLTDQGRRVFARLNQASSDAVGAMIRDLSEAQRGELLAAMTTIRRLLQRHSAPSAYRLRPLRSGDIGWIIHRQGVLYAEEYGWDATYEALVAEIRAAFVKTFDPRGGRGLGRRAPGIHRRLGVSRQSVH